MFKKIIAFDLDDVICRRTSESGSVEKYKTCYPVREMVELVNQCYDSGYKIIIYTARGMNVFKKDVNKVSENLYQLTSSQLSTWGVKYHELVMGKIHYDILIDDKAYNSLIFKSLDDVENIFKNADVKNDKRPD